MAPHAWCAACQHQSPSHCLLGTSLAPPSELQSPLNRAPLSCLLSPLNHAPHAAASCLYLRASCLSLDINARYTNPALFPSAVAAWQEIHHHVLLPVSIWLQHQYGYARDPLQPHPYYCIYSSWFVRSELKTESERPNIESSVHRFSHANFGSQYLKTEKPDPKYRVGPNTHPDSMEYTKYF